MKKRILAFCTGETRGKRICLLRKWRDALRASVGRIPPFPVHLLDPFVPGHEEKTA